MKNSAGQVHKVETLVGSCSIQTPDVPFSHFQTSDYAVLLQKYDQVPIWFVAKGADDDVLATWLLFETTSDYINPKFRTLSKIFDVNLKGVHGPTFKPDLLSDDRQNILNELFLALKKYIQKRKPLSVSVSLDPLSDENDRSVWTNACQEQGLSTQKGWTYAIELPSDPDALSKMIKADRRTKIRKAQKLGVEVQSGNDLDLVQDYATLRNQNNSANKFDEVPFSYFKDTHDVFASNGVYKIFIARLEDRIAAVQQAFVFNGYVYLAGVSTADWVYKEKVPANDLLQWNVLSWAVEQGCKVVDFSGACPDSDDPKMKAIDSFKSRWGTKLCETVVIAEQHTSLKRYLVAALQRLKRL